MFKQGDCVRIKQGVNDPDYPEIDLSGWQGRIVSYEGKEADGELYTLAWDSISLKALDEDVILDAIEEEIDYTLISLYAHDLEKAEARDTEKDVELAIAELDEEFFWSDLGEQGARIREVLNTAKSKSEADMLKAWEKHLKSKLKFPVQVIYVGESTGPFKEGAKFQLLGIDSISEIMGLMGTAKLDKGNSVVPLCDLDVEIEGDDTESMYDYCIWYANH
jgi:hypothetical protein